MQKEVKEARKGTVWDVNSASQVNAVVIVV